MATETFSGGHGRPTIPTKIEAWNECLDHELVYVATMSDRDPGYGNEIWACADPRHFDVPPVYYVGHGQIKAAASYPNPWSKPLLALAMFRDTVRELGDENARGNISAADFVQYVGEALRSFTPRPLP